MSEVPEEAVEREGREVSSSKNELFAARMALEEAIALLREYHGFDDYHQWCDEVRSFLARVTAVPERGE